MVLVTAVMMVDLDDACCHPGTETTIEIKKRKCAQNVLTKEEEVTYYA